jgi:gentisate 1,2-dioxygenase
MASVSKVNGVNAIAGNGLGPQTRIISLSKTNITAGAIADLNAAVQYLAAGDVAGTNDAHTIAGIDHTSANVAHVVLQGTGAFTAASNFGEGSTGVTSALVATFTD